MTRQNELANGSSVAHCGQSIVLVAFDGCGTAAGAGVFRDRTLALAVLIIRIYKAPAAAVADEQTFEANRVKVRLWRGTAVAHTRRKPTLAKSGLL